MSRKKVPVIILNQRAESISGETISVIITARALAPLDTLLDYCFLWADASPAFVMLFLKREKAPAEIDAAR